MSSRYRCTPVDREYVRGSAGWRGPGRRRSRPTARPTKSALVDHPAICGSRRHPTDRHRAREVGLLDLEPNRQAADELVPGSLSGSAVSSEQRIRPELVRHPARQLHAHGADDVDLGVACSRRRAAATSVADVKTRSSSVTSTTRVAASRAVVAPDRHPRAERPAMALDQGVRDSDDRHRESTGRRRCCRRRPCEPTGRGPLGRCRGALGVLTGLRHRPGGARTAPPGRDGWEPGDSR